MQERAKRELEWTLVFADCYVCDMYALRILYCVFLFFEVTKCID